MCVDWLQTNVGRSVTGSRMRNSSPASALPGLISTAQSGLIGSKAGSSTSAAGPVPTAAKDGQVVRKPTPVSGKWMVEGADSSSTGKTTTAVAAGGRLTASELIQQQMQRDNGDSRLFMSPTKDEEFDEDEDESLVDSEDYRAADEVGMTLDINACEYTHQLLTVPMCMK